MLNSVGVQGIYPYLNETTRAMSRALGRLNFRKKYYKSRVKAELSRAIRDHIQKGDGRTDIEYLITARRPLMIKLLRTQFIRDILTKEQIDQLITHPQHYPAVMLQLMYIYAFYELFVTGKYDAYFNRPVLKTPLAMLLTGPIFQGNPDSPS